MMRLTSFPVTLGLLLPGLIACSNPIQPGAGDQPGSAIRVERIKVAPQVLHLLAIGDTTRLRATIGPANATDQAILWESTDPGVVSVDADGVVTAKAAGLGVFITAITHDGHFQASVNVGVGP